MELFSKVLQLRSLFRPLILVYASLIAALTVRFLWMMFIDRIESERMYDQFVTYSIRAFQNSVLPIVLVGVPIFFGYLRFKRSTSLVMHLIQSMTALSVFFGVMVGIGFLVGPGYTFPRITWLVAWLFSLLGCATALAVNHTDAAFRSKIFYSRANQLFIDAASVAAGFAFAYLVRFDGLPPAEFQAQTAFVLPYVILLYLLVNFLFGVYSFVWRFTSLREAIVIGQSTLTSALLVLICRIIFLESVPALRIPFGILIVHPLLVYGGLIGARVVRRVQYRYRLTGSQKAGTSANEKGIRRLLLVGAGQMGQQLVRELEVQKNFEIVGFLDDDPGKFRKVIHGVRVLGKTQDVVPVVRQNAVDEVVLCMSTAPKPVIRQIVAACERIPVNALTIPGLSEMLLGHVSIGQLRPVRMEDLLRRDAVRYSSDDLELISHYRGKRILVTGAGGSIGSELVRQLRYFDPTLLMLLDRDENSLYETGLEVREEFAGEVAEIVADIRDANRIRRIVENWKPQVVFHAAAYKQVPIMETNPAEAILNNVIGSWNLVEASIAGKVESFVLISTDKAVNPTSIMGTSKRLAEILVQDASRRAGQVRFCCVRFGNVLGSRGSVVPIFEKRIAMGKNLRVTHPDVRRYFMTIPEAVQLVIQAGSLGRAGEIFLLDMGEPVKIVDLATQLIEASGLQVGKDLAIEFSGLRPGEKLFEELLIKTENGARDTKYPKIFVVKAVQNSWPSISAVLKLLQQAALEEDCDTIFRVLESLDIGYIKTPGTALVGSAVKQS